MTTTTERRAGNEYEVGQRYLVSDGNTREVTLSGVMPNGCGSGCVTHARWKEPHGGMNGGCLTSDGRGFVGVYMKRIDVPAAAPLAADRTGPPAGYVPCAKGCGRWTTKSNLRCWRCFYPNQPNKWATYDALPGTADWLPPLAAQPAETKRFIAIDPAVPGSERTAHRCTGCDWWIDSTCMVEEDVTRLVHEHLAKDHACKPAPQPAPAKLECDVRDEEIPCGGALLKRIFSHDLPPGMLCDAHYLLRETRFEVSREQSTGILRNPAVPERLERPKLAHSSMWADEAEDVS